MNNKSTKTKRRSNLTMSLYISRTRRGRRCHEEAEMERELWCGSSTHGVGGGEGTPRVGRRKELWKLMRQKKTMLGGGPAEKIGGQGDSLSSWKTTRTSVLIKVLEYCS
ncbi:hypothetical protein HA466_0193430 [Hirschfeldia incana]|nr:hypothetical protein HA466_0193430 [Hirschfeldia incana]